jgi:hypothetical protein
VYHPNKRASLTCQYGSGGDCQNGRNRPRPAKMAASSKSCAKQEKSFGMIFALANHVPIAPKKVKSFVKFSLHKNTKISLECSRTHGIMSI